MATFSKVRNGQDSTFTAKGTPSIQDSAPNEYLLQVQVSWGETLEGRERMRAQHDDGEEMFQYGIYLPVVSVSD